MQFTRAAPGNLTEEGGVFYADWSVADSNFGYTKAQVEAWVSSALNGPLGWEQAGVQFRQVPTGNVIFQVVETISGPANTLGIAYWNDFPVLVELEAAYYNNMDLVNHEAGHAFFYASHSVEGAISLMEPMEDPGEEWTSDADISEIRRWLGIDGSPDPPPPPQALPPKTYWHPLDLPHYITKRDLSGASESRVSVAVPNVRRAGLEPGNNLKAIYSADYEAMKDGEYEDLGEGVWFGEPGFYTSGWEEIPEGAKGGGEVYVGMTITTHLPIDELSLGQAEVRIR